MLWISVVNVKQTIKNHFWQLKIKKKKNLDEDVSLKNLKIGNVAFESIKKVEVEVLILLKLKWKIKLTKILKQTKIKMKI